MKTAENNKTGIFQWVGKGYNIQKGCERNCGYCYAMRISKFGGWCPEAGWNKPEFNEKAFNQNVSRYYELGVMFPTSHDITLNNLEKCCQFIKRILKESKNQILIVSKPELPCIEALCHELEDWRERITFRFTITSCYDDIIKKWEPNAPLFEERLRALILAYHNEYNTSVSVEPFLDIDPTPLIEEVSRFTTGEIWLGAMSGRKYEYHTADNLKLVMEELRSLPMAIQNKLKIKDSLQKLINKYEINSKFTK